MKPLRLLGATVVIGAVVAAVWSYRVTQNPAAVTPTLLQLSTGVPGGTWSSVTREAPLMFFALPLREPSMGVQMILTAPHPSTLTMTAVDPATTTTAVLGEISPGVNEPATGFFRVDRVDTASRPPRWFVTVRAPAMFESVPVTRYTIGVTNVSNNPFLSGTAGTSAPLVVTLATKPDFTVTVRIDGPGHVTSRPPGIHCPTSCQNNFAFPGPVAVPPVPV